MMRMDIVIVNYRTAELVIECLRSLGPQVDRDGVVARVWVVENGSGDDSLARLRAAAGAMGNWVQVLDAGRNGGFAAGNNVGIAAAMGDGAGWERPDLVLLLNPDTIVQAGALAELARFMAGHPRAGICGSRLLGRDGEIEQAGHAFPGPLRELARGAYIGVITRTLLHPVDCSTLMQPHRFDWVTGAALCIRREVLEQIGLLDEGYFLYFEEIDFCRRASRASRGSWEVWHVPASRIIHLEGSATGIADTARRRPRYWFDSRRRYFIKHHGLVGLLAADAFWAVGRVLHSIARVLRLCPRPTSVPRRFGADLLLGDLAAVVRGRGGTRLRDDGGAAA